MHHDANPFQGAGTHMQHPGHHPSEQNPHQSHQPLFKLSMNSIAFNPRFTRFGASGERGSQGTMTSGAPKTPLKMTGNMAKTPLGTSMTKTPLGSTIGVKTPLSTIGLYRPPFRGNHADNAAPVLTRIGSNADVTNDLARSDRRHSMIPLTSLGGQRHHGDSVPSASPLASPLASPMSTPNPGYLSMSSSVAASAYGKSNSIGQPMHTNLGQTNPSQPHLSQSASMDMPTNSEPLVKMQRYSIGISGGEIMGVQPTPSRNHLAHDRTKELEAKVAELDAQRVEWIGIRSKLEAKIEELEGGKSQGNLASRHSSLQELRRDNAALRTEKIALARELDDARVEAALVRAETASMKAGYEEIKAENMSCEMRLLELQNSLSEDASSALAKNMHCWANSDNEKDAENKELKSKLKELSMQYDASRMLNEELRLRLEKSISVYSATNSPIPSPIPSPLPSPSNINSPSTRSCASSSSLLQPGTLARRAAARARAGPCVAVRPVPLDRANGKTNSARTSLPSGASMTKLGDKARPKGRTSLPPAKAKAKCRISSGTTKLDRAEPWWDEDTADFEKLEASVRQSLSVEE